MLVISILVMGLGGYALLEALFSSSWQREVENGAEENPDAGLFLCGLLEYYGPGMAELFRWGYPKDGGGHG